MVSNYRHNNEMKHFIMLKFRKNYGRSTFNFRLHSTLDSIWFIKRFFCCCFFSCSAQDLFLPKQKIPLKIENLISLQAQSHKLWNSMSNLFRFAWILQNSKNICRNFMQLKLLEGVQYSIRMILSFNYLIHFICPSVMKWKYLRIEG